MAHWHWLHLSLNQSIIDGHSKRQTPCGQIGLAASLAEWTQGEVAVTHRWGKQRAPGLRAASSPLAEKKKMESINLVISSWKTHHLPRSSEFTRHQKDKMLEERLSEQKALGPPRCLKAQWERHRAEQTEALFVLEKSSHLEKTDRRIKQNLLPFKERRTRGGGGEGFVMWFVDFKRF